MMNMNIIVIFIGYVHRPMVLVDNYIFKLKIPNVGGKKLSMFMETSSNYH